MIGEFSAASYSSGPSNYFTLVGGANLCKDFLFADRLIIKISKADFNIVLLKSTKAAPPNKPSLWRNTPVTCYEEISNEIPIL
jgi:hypothetical protein